MKKTQCFWWVHIQYDENLGAAISPFSPSLMQSMFAQSYLVYTDIHAYRTQIVSWSSVAPSGDKSEGNLSITQSYIHPKANQTLWLNHLEITKASACNQDGPEMEPRWMAPRWLQDDPEMAPLPLHCVQGLSTFHKRDVDHHCYIIQSTCRHLVCNLGAAISPLSPSLM